MVSVKKHYQKLKLKQKNSKGSFFNNLDNPLYFKFQAGESGYLTLNQIESARRVLVRGTSRNAIIRINKFFYYPLTYKAKNARMGKGKGKVKLQAYFAKIQKGVTLFTVSNLDIKNFKKYKSWKNLLTIATTRLPLKVFIKVNAKDKYFL